MSKFLREKNAAMSVSRTVPAFNWPQLIFVATLLGVMLFQIAQAADNRLGLQTMLAAQIPADEPVRAVAMLEQIPDANTIAALQAQGLIAQPLKHLPMALTKGTVAQLRAVVEQGLARDVYLDRRLQWHSAESTAAMSADVTRELGFDGSGIGVAVVDSGIDASHTDLANRVVRNVRVYSPEYLDITGVGTPLGIEWPAEPALVLPFDALPYNNTDTIGHGTHVAGIVAADASGDPELVGVAPGADIIGYSTGEILFIFTALASFDDILATHEEYNIRVINNSWGSSYQVFNPDSPINVATKILAETGITVVFSAGNDGLEMTTNVHSMAPWVINSGSATISAEKSDFSSSGLMYDNTVVAALDADGHVRHEGDGLGLSHPDTSAPGSNIISTGTPTGVVTTTGTPPNGSASASGTSMSAPHMSGLAAVILQANPTLTPKMVRQVMQLSTVPMRDGAAFWQSGFGFVDAKLAVDLAQRSDLSAALLDQMEAEAEARVKAARDYSVLASDHWIFNELLATVAGLESHSFNFEVGADTDAIRAGVAFPGDLGIVGLNLLYEWQLNLIDPDGNQVASSELLPDLGVGILHADFAELGLPKKPGTWTIEAVGQTHLAQPGLLWGHTISVAATQLKTQQSSVGEAGPVFEAQGQMTWSMAGGSGQVDSPEGCDYNVLGASGSLTQGAADPDCRAGTVGYTANFAPLIGAPASFTSEPLAQDRLFGGDGQFRLVLTDALQPVWSLAFSSSLDYQIDAVNDAGELITPIASGSFDGGTIAGSGATLGEYPISVPPTAVSAGQRIRLQVWITGVYSSTARLLWGGDYADSGLSLSFGEWIEARDEAAPVDAPARGDGLASRGGALSWWLLVCLLPALGLRRRSALIRLRG